MNTTIYTITSVKRGDPYVTCTVTPERGWLINKNTVKIHQDFFYSKNMQVGTQYYVCDQGEIKLV